MQSPTEGSSGCLGCQIGCQWRNGFGIVTRIICKLDGNSFCGALRNGAVQLLNGSLGFYTLIETDETNTFGEPLKRTKQKWKLNTSTPQRHTYINHKIRIEKENECCNEDICV